MNAELSQGAQSPPIRAANRPPVEVHLRELTAADLPALFALENDPMSSRQAAVVPRDWEAFQAHWAKVLTNADVTTRGILQEDKLVGQVSSFSRDGKSWVGYWIDRAHWNRGIATRGLALLLEQLATRPLFARIALQNVASRRVLERRGFTEIERSTCPGDERFLPCEEVILKLL